MNKIQEFISDHKKEAVIALCLLVLILFTIILILIFSGQSKTGNKLENKTVPEVKIDSKVLWLLEEPLDLPPIQFSREQRKIWEDEEIKYWYEPPSKEAMEKINKKNKKLVDNILEAAP